MNKGNTRAAKLSGGQKRKLSIGIALIGDPKVTAIAICVFIASRCPHF